MKSVTKSFVFLLSIIVGSIIVSTIHAQSTSIVLTPPIIPAASSEIISPLRGYYRWRDQEKIDREVAPSKDAYQRYVWSDLETTEGNYTFWDSQTSQLNPNSQLNKDIAAAASRGQKFILAVRALIDTSGYVYNCSTCVPAYLKPYGWYSNGVFIPDWNSNVFIRRAEALIAKLGEAYNNDPRISMIEMRMYGLYGEWHMYGVDYATAPVMGDKYCADSICDASYKPIIPDGTTATTLGATTLRRFINAYINAFPNKPLIAMTGQENINDSVEYALSKRLDIGLRNDGLGLWYVTGTVNGVRRSGMAEYFRDMAKLPYWTKNTYTNNASESLGMNRWKYAPMIVEYAQVTPGDKETYLGTGQPVFQVAQQQVKDFHISLIGNGNMMTTFSSFSAQEQTDAILAGKLAGYRTILKSLTLPSTITAGNSFQTIGVWENVGVAPIYESWNTYLQLRNSSGSVVWEGKSLASLKRILPNSSAPYSQTDTFTIDTPLPSGIYTVSVMVRDPDNVRQPLPLAISGRSSDGSYPLGQISYATFSSPAPTSAPKPWTTLESDYSTWLSHYLQSVTGFTNGDFSENGMVDGIDYVLWLNNYAN